MEWKDPPGASRGLTEEAAELRRHPGRWGMVIVHENRDKARRQRERILDGKALPFRPKGSFQVTLRDREDGAVEMYACYIGEEGQHAATGTVDGTGVGPGSGPADQEPDGRAGTAVDLPGAIAPDSDRDR